MAVAGLPLLRMEVMVEISSVCVNELGGGGPSAVVVVDIA